MKFSKAFMKKWMEYFGYEPYEEEIKKMIEDSIVVQRFKVIRKRDGSVFKIAQIYWNTNENILFKMDEDTKTLITFAADKKMYGESYARV
ncbi:hypothetical protein FHQ18_11555 [Deferribacter autotrophicus]|uniref:Uncharacterized protein n=1 Tax=Deferribacter autotrophicus TaxID=500465 RepID=A0A5A8F0R7_9BACT|nr:hypothetical protein [Deferribacter autotrophicus]KAA0257193.1 hypothetical protein FHQ18_11555 [Deferribacter autotrophicus]